MAWTEITRRKYQQRWAARCKRHASGLGCDRTVPPPAPCGQRCALFGYRTNLMEPSDLQRNKAVGCSSVRVRLSVL
jgi:hypothetical protein